MKHVDRLVLAEILGPWCFGVAMFSVLIFAGNYLFQVSQYFVSGAPAGEVVELVVLFLPGVIIKTFSMALLLAGLLGFGRLSSDSEVVALRAAGISIRRMMVPVAGFSLAVAIVSFALNELVVPPATMHALELQDTITKNLTMESDQALATTVKDKTGRVTLMVAALGFDLGTRTLRDVTITSYDKAENPNFYLYVPKLAYQGESQWRIIGGAQLSAANGGYHLQLTGDAWPQEITKQDLSFKPENLLRQNLKALDAFSLSEMREQIAMAKLDPQTKKKQIANLEYGFWNKFALPLAALVYGLLGAPLGIRNVRTGAATGFAVSVAIIFAYITLANLMNVYAEGGVIPAYLASFTPLLIGLVAAGVIIWRRNG
jgi:lipopolysaccharide export system permease protein